MELFDSRVRSRPRWASFENPTGGAGTGGSANNGAKGSPSRYIESGEEVALLDVAGCGVIRKIWMALDRYTESEAMESLVIKMYWDGAETPAVECPLGEFFAFGTNRVRAYDSELFSSPEGRSLNCFIPMPFYKSAKIVLCNNYGKRVLIFYDVEFTLEPLEAGSALYFHAKRNKGVPELCFPHVVLPRVEGRGRYLGTSLGVEVDRKAYGDSWFGEGEVKFYIDGDRELPTLVGTGTEDYIGDGWGQGEFCNRTQGCTFADGAEYAFYRWHTFDPICFEKEIRVTIDLIGNGTREAVRRMQSDGAELSVTAIAGVGVYERGKSAAVPEGCPTDSVLFFRRDLYSSVAYYYLETP